MAVGDVSNVVREEASGGRAALAHVTQESLTCLVNIARKQIHMSCAYMYAGDHKETTRRPVPRDRETAAAR